MKSAIRSMVDSGTAGLSEETGGIWNSRWAIDEFNIHSGRTEGPCGWPERSQRVRTEVAGHPGKVRVLAGDVPECVDLVVVSGDHASPSHAWMSA